MRYPVKLRQIESFLNVLSLSFRKFFLDLRLQFAFSENDEIAEITVSKIEKGSGVVQTPSAIFSVTTSTVRFIKLDFTSQIDFVEYQVGSLFELRTTILYVVFLLIRAEHENLTLYAFLSKVLGARIDAPRDLLMYFCQTNEIDFEMDDDVFYVYDYGNFSFYQDAISFFSTKSARVVYKIDSEDSVFMVVSLIFDSLFCSVNEDPSGDQFVKVFAIEDPESGQIAEPEPEEEGMGDFGGGFDDAGLSDDMGGGGSFGSFPSEEGSDSGLSGGGFPETEFQE